MTAAWRDAVDDLDALVLDGLQRGFPVAPRPFERVASDLDVSGAKLRGSAQRLLDEGLLRRFGPVIDAPTVGSSSLAAVRAPPERIDAVAEAVNDHRRVNHNYRRSHDRNLWFVVTAEDVAAHDAVIDDVEHTTGLDALVLPMRTEYAIDLTFPVVNDDAVARQDALSRTASEPTPVDREPADLTRLQRRLLLAVQGGMPVVDEPYRALAEDVGADRGAVLAALRALRDDGCLRRIGGVVDHRRVGFTANCMVVWDVPDDGLPERGVGAARVPHVTYCCRRVRRPEQGWRYNVFTMIHGRDRGAVEATVDELEAVLEPRDHARLHTEEALKQTGVRYEELLANDGETPTPSR